MATSTHAQVLAVLTPFDGMAYSAVTQNDVIEAVGTPGHPLKSSLLNRVEINRIESQITDELTITREINEQLEHTQELTNNPELQNRPQVKLPAEEIANRNSQYRTALQELERKLKQQAEEQNGDDDTVFQKSFELVVKKYPDIRIEKNVLIEILQKIRRRIDLEEQMANHEEFTPEQTQEYQESAPEAIMTMFGFDIANGEAQAAYQELSPLVVQHKQNCEQRYNAVMEQQSKLDQLLNSRPNLEAVKEFNKNLEAQSALPRVTEEQAQTKTPTLTIQTA